MSLIKPQPLLAVDKNLVLRLLRFLLTCLTAMTPDFNYARQNRHHNNRDDQQFQVLLHHRQIPKQVARVREQQHPQQRTETLKSAKWR